MALLQEAPPRWLARLGRCCRASGALALTSRNELPALRAAAAAAQPGPDRLERGRLEHAARAGSRPGGPRGARAACHPPGAPHPPAGPRLAPGRGARCRSRACTCRSTRPVRGRPRPSGSAELATRFAGATPLLFGGDLNLRPRDHPATFASLRDSFGLVAPTSPGAIDHLLTAGAPALSPPLALEPSARELHVEPGRRLRLSDHAPVAGTLRGAIVRTGSLTREEGRWPSNDGVSPRAVLVQAARESPARAGRTRSPPLRAKRLARRAASGSSSKPKAASRSTAAKKSAETRKANERKRSAAAKKGARTRAAQGKSSGASSQARKAGAQTAEMSAKSAAEVREALSKSLVDPMGLLMLTREYIEEAVNDAVSRGRVTADDAQDLITGLVERGRKQTNDVMADLEHLLGRGRGQIEDRTETARKSGSTAARRARKQVEDATSRAREQADPVLAQADRARRAAGLGPSFPITGYDELTVAQVQARLADLSPAELRKVRDYERRHANRKTVLDGIGEKLD
ncbi:MAG: hypothetical protein WKF40_08500 [Thermoleophilaceae bacterium]